MTMAATTMVREGIELEHQPAYARLRQRIRAEFLEMPGLKLTLPQAARIFGIDAPRSAALLQDLVDEGFLARNVGGAYTRDGLVVS